MKTARVVAIFVVAWILFGVSGCLWAYEKCPSCDPEETAREGRKITGKILISINSQDERNCPVLISETLQDYVTAYLQDVIGEDGELKTFWLNKIIDRAGSNVASITSLKAEKFNGELAGKIAIDYINGQRRIMTIISNGNVICSVSVCLPQ